MATPDPVEETQSYIEELEGFVTKGFVEVTGRKPSPSELEIRASVLAKEDGRDYFADKKLLFDQPGPIGKTINAVGKAVGSVFRPVLSGAVHAVADRTQSLRSEDSSLPSIPLFKPTVETAQGSSPPFGMPSFGVEGARFGAEQLADAIELGVPAVTEAVALGSRRLGGLPGRVGAILLGNISSEVGAEYIRYANLKASGIQNNEVDANDPTDVALHFAKVAAGGALLGSADLAVNSSALRAQRQMYRTTLGLGTPESNVALARIERLGVEPNLAQAMTTVLRPIGTSLAVYPMTSKGAIEQGRRLVRGISQTTTDAVSRLADHLVSGVHISGRSASWAKANDKFVQFARKKGNAAYGELERVTNEAVAQHGLLNVHVDHTQAAGEIKTLLSRNSNLPLIATGDPDTPFKLSKTSLERNPDYQLLLDAVNMTSQVHPIQYISFRNQLEGAAARAGGANDPDGRMFSEAARLMREAVETNMTAPPEVLSAFNAAQRQWSDYNALANSAAWKHFRRADPQFGFASKVSDKKPATSAEVVLQNAMSDPDLSPEIVETWWRAAREGQAVSQFRGAVESHIQAGLRKAVVVPEKGTLAGMETIKIDTFLSFLGADDPNGNVWAAHRAMIRNSGGDPDALLAFLNDAKVAFPDGIPNPSQTAARRTGLSGLGSAVRFVTGASVVGALGGSAGGGAGSTVGAIGMAAASFIALAGVGQLMFNPAVLRRMRMVMDGGISEQGRWRTLWGVASSVGLTRPLQMYLQEQGIDPLVDPSKADLLNQMQMNRSARNPLPSSPVSPTLNKNTPKIGPRQ